ncbi:glycoside hydrolase family protein [Pantoea sp. C2G6]|uniref:glycoside hydrolase family protein n=1 Tax=Pantoea sp. C2G6 TaxID=3243084 RepID=UPI003EDA95B8
MLWLCSTNDRSYTERVYKKECDVLLDKTLYKDTIVLNNLPVMPVSTTVGFLDFAYNAGINVANSSKVKKRLAEGNYAQASKAVLQWRYVSQKKPDYSKGCWEHRNGKYYYDCSKYHHGKPNKLCYGLYTRRLMESELLAGTMTDKEEIQSYIHKFGK